MTPSQPDRISVLLVSALVAIWGSSFLLIALALQGFSPVAVAFLRVAFACIALLTALALTGTHLPATAREWAWCVANGIIGLALPFTLLAFAIQTVASSTAAVFIAAVPLFILALSRIIFGDRISTRRWGGFSIGLAGLLWLAGPEAVRAVGSSGQGLGQLACVAAALCYATGAMIVRAMPPIDPLPATAASHLGAAALLLPFGLPALPAAMPPLTPVAALLVLGVLQTGLAQTLRFMAIRRAGTIFISVVGYLIPVWAGIFGYLILGEAITPRSLIAFLLIIGGLLLARQRNHKEKS